MHEQYHTWDKDFVYLPVYLTGGSSYILLFFISLFLLILKQIDINYLFYYQTGLKKARKASQFSKR